MKWLVNYRVVWFFCLISLNVERIFIVLSVFKEGRKGIWYVLI